MPVKPISLAILLGPALFWASQAVSDRLEHVGTLEWKSEAFVGLSGLEISPDGAGFHAVSDRGWFLSGRIERDAAGDISSLALDRLLPILGNDGLPVTARRVGDWSDAEGLAIAPDGTMWISFERWAHVSRYAAPDAPGQWIRDHPSFAEFRDNRQLEALALHPDGTLLAFSETPLAEGFPIYRLAGENWVIDGYFQTPDGFSVVGADFDEDGRLYLLERRLILLTWWQSRVRRMILSQPDEAETLWTSARGAFHNLEGIALWHDGNATRITVVSDDNGDPDEPTQFVEFRLIAE